MHGLFLNQAGVKYLQGKKACLNGIKMANAELRWLCLRGKLRISQSGRDQIRADATCEDSRLGGRSVIEGLPVLQ
jgi:hypothetical protein